MKKFYRSIYLYSTIAAAAFLLTALQARAITIDGSGEAGYGAALAVNVNPTGFGDSSYTGSDPGPLPDANGSELDAAYGVISGGNLNIFVSGNFENNGNKVDIFISDGRAGQSTLAAQPTASLGQNMNGSKFSPGFSATYALCLGDFQDTAFVEEYDLVANTGGFVGSFLLSSGIGSGNPGGGSVIQYGINNSNTAGVTGATGSVPASLAVNTGLELSIPLSLLGNPTGSIDVLASINSGNNSFLANQFLPGLPSGTGNVGGGGPYSGGGGSGQFDFSGTPGEFFTVVPEPSTIGLVVVGLFGALAIRRRKA